MRGGNQGWKLGVLCLSVIMLIGMGLALAPSAVAEEKP